MLGFDGFGEVSKRVSPEDPRVMEKPNGVVLWRVKMRSEVGLERMYPFFFDEVEWLSGREGALR